MIGPTGTELATSNATPSDATSNIELAAVGSPAGGGSSGAASAPLSPAASLAAADNGSTAASASPKRDASLGNTSDVFPINDGSAPDPDNGDDNGSTGASAPLASASPDSLAATNDGSTSAS